MAQPDQQYGTFWRFINSLWIVLTFTFLLNWLAFIYIGVRTRQGRWILSGVIYFLPVLSIFIPSANQSRFNLTMWSVLGMGVISLIHGLRVRKEYLLRLEALQGKWAQDAQAQRARIASQYGVQLAPSVAPPAAAPAAAVVPGVQPLPVPPAPPKPAFKRPVPAGATPPAPPAVPAPAPVAAAPAAPPVQTAPPVPPTAATVDLNTAPEADLATLPGVGPILAKKAVAVRQSKGGFHSLEEFADTLELKPHVTERIRSLVQLSPVKAPVPQPAPGGRVIDF